MKKAFFIILFFIISTPATFACSCAQTNETLSKKVKKEFSQSDLIINGKVIEIEVVNKAKIKSSADPIIYKFEITKIIKGKTTNKIIEIVSRVSSASCGYSFKKGKSYLVYARKSKEFSKMTNNKFDFVTSLCDRNQKIKDVDKKELKILKNLNRKSS